MEFKEGMRPASLTLTEDAQEHRVIAPPHSELCSDLTQSCWQVKLSGFDSRVPWSSAVSLPCVALSKQQQLRD